jgi:hypothetical protein
MTRKGRITRINLRIFCPIRAIHRIHEILFLFLVPVCPGKDVVNIKIIAGGRVPVKPASSGFQEYRPGFRSITSRNRE